MKHVAIFTLTSALALAATAALLACSSSTTVEPGEEETDGGTTAKDGSADSTPSPESGLGELLFRPSTLYSGVDGTNTFVAPVAVYDADSDLTVTASDPSAVTITPVKLKNPEVDGIVDNGKYFFVTTKKAGTITLTASSKGRTAKSTLTIADYASTRWAAGKARYEKAGSNADRPCTECHVNGAAIDHSPATMSSATDQDIAVIIKNGIKPGGLPITGVPGGHKWNATDTEVDGLVTYLRALRPNGFQ
ncbi:MAG: hypothetical protein JST00_33370 [Deltaproteobacteria bacterium]|nr:hypothetical protein [Deltaproteobacteria bacterium]